jgi:hypothetical protein
MFFLVIFIIEKSIIVGPVSFTKGIPDKALRVLVFPDTWYGDKIKPFIKISFSFSSLFIAALPVLLSEF